MFLEIISIAVLLFVAIVLSIQFFYIALGGYAPFFLTKEKVMKKIIDEISFGDDEVVYELGCGNAGFLRAVEKKFPELKKLTGVEWFFFPYLIGSIQTSLKRSKIKILKKNFFEIDLEDADVVYCFLNKKTMRGLKDKFLRECKKGTQIISYQFTLPEIKPEKVIDLENNEKDKVYFYTI